MPFREQKSSQEAEALPPSPCPDRVVIMPHRMYDKEQGWQLLLWDGSFDREIYLLADFRLQACSALARCHANEIKINILGSVKQCVNNHTPNNLYNVPHPVPG